MSPLSTSRPMKAGAAWLCATFSVGCPAAQVRPLPEDCPREAIRSMEELNLFKGTYQVIIDINQPGNGQQEGIYRSGPIVGKVKKYSWTGPLPDGTLLYGQLWTEGISKIGYGAVYGRYTEAQRQDLTWVPVCLQLHDRTNGTLGVPKLPGSGPGAALLLNGGYVKAVQRFE